MNYEEFDTYWKKDNSRIKGVEVEGYSKKEMWKLIDGIQKTPISDFFKDSISLMEETKPFFEKAKKDIWVLMWHMDWTKSAYGPPISGIKTDFGYFTKTLSGNKLSGGQTHNLFHPIYSCVKYLYFFFQTQDKNSEFFNISGFLYKSAFKLKLMETGLITNYNPNNIVFINWNVNPLEVK